MSSTPHPLITPITAFVHECMKNYDPSHNPAHISRVVNLALRIFRSEVARHPKKSIDEVTLHLAALLHDISDRKYLPKDQDATANAIPPEKLVEHVLIQHGAEKSLAERVQKIVSHVSYSTECKDPSAVRKVIDEEGVFELAIVQDADRLDAIGAVGIGRCFTFLGAKGRDMLKEGEAWEMENSIRHFGEKLERLEGMMKTETGREMARVRTERLVEFKKWWEEEIRNAGEY
ncbi:HD domain-containing protein [Aspergillus stella-maris]|uniref:HD domain-containing protein n=1 Tax=Aspergillus stella-maris TaxID=1810926 RepID=UPI003CCE0E67